MATSLTPGTAETRARNVFKSSDDERVFGGTETAFAIADKFWFFVSECIDILWIYDNLPWPLRVIMVRVAKYIAKIIAKIKHNQNQIERFMRDSISQKT